MARWNGWKRARTSAPIPARYGTRPARVIMLGLNYGPDRDPLDILARRDRGAISVYAQGEDYHDVVKKKLKAVAGFIFETSRAEVKVFVDTAPVMEKPLAQKAGIGLARQAHQSGEPRIRLLAVSGFDLHHPGVAARRRRTRSLRQLPPVPRHLPDRCLSRPVPDRCAALHFLSHHREQGADPARIPGTDRQSDLWLRRLPGRLPLEQIRPERPRDEIAAPGGIARAGAWRIGGTGRCRLPRPLPQIAGQADRPRALPAQCADRDRQ